MKLMTVNLVVMLLSICVLCSCQDEMDKYYERPPYLRGNAWEYMQSAGNFTCFLKAAELTGWKRTLNGYGLCTVMAPDDEAFKAYLDGKALEDIPLEKLNVLVSYHIIENAFNTEKFLGFTMTRPEEKPTVGTGNCFKYKTFSRDPVSRMFDPVNKRTVDVFNREKFLPVVSTRIFKSKGCTNSEENYRYFFPEVDWVGDDEKLYVQNASVKEYGIPTDNGYIYILNRVAEPLPNLYQTLSGLDDYSDFVKLCDKFALVKQDKDLTNQYAAPGDTIYVYEHGVLPHLYSEWTYHNEVNSNERYYDKFMKYSYNCFAPDNRAWENFYRTYLSAYASLDDVPLTTLYYILKNHVKEKEEILFPEVIREGGRGVNGEYGEKWYVNPENVRYHRWCANGLMYGIDHVLEPVLFKTVSAPMFLNPGYGVMTQMLHASTEFPQLIDQTSDRYTLFMLSDTTWNRNYGITLDNGAMNVFGDEKVVENGDEYVLDNIRVDVQSHVVYGAVRNMNKRAFYATQNPFTYIYTDEGMFHGENGGEITVLNKWDETDGIVNGVVYEIDDKFTKNPEESNIVYWLKLNYVEFYTKLVAAGLIDSKDVFTSLAGDRAIVFAPSDDVMRTANLPTDKTALAEYLSYYFVSLNQNKMSDYFLPNYGALEIEGSSLQLQTLQKDAETKVASELIVKQSNEKCIKVSNPAGDEIETDGEVPFFASDGLVYGIRSLIESKN